MSKLFVDVHCHIFTLEDIPIYKTMDSSLGNVNILNKLLISIGGGLAGSLGAAFPILGNLLDKNQEIIYAFSRSKKENIALFIKELSVESVAGDSKKIITPLIMDFEMLTENDNPRVPQKAVIEQWKSLDRAISESKQLLTEHNFYIFPFIGLDLRKLQTEKNVKHYMDDLWRRCNGLKKELRHSVNPSVQLLPGESHTIGIKLYPPISDNPYPEKEDYLANYLAFYDWCIENSVPITVHCQKGSYQVKKNRQVEKQTDPKNWAKVLKAKPQLTINFAHFGGDDEVDEAIDPFHRKELDPDSWTSTIVDLLKHPNYKNTYSDLAAFAYKNKRALRNLRQIIELDNNNKLGAGYKLAEKLLWGSDVPMIVSDDEYQNDKEEAHYQHYYHQFTQMVNKSKRLDKQQKHTFIDNLTSHNALKFLDIKV